MQETPDTMVSDLASAIERYEEVATKYTRHQTECFIRDVRAHFVPFHETCDDPDGNIWPDLIDVQKDGYTAEGAIALRVYEHGFREAMPREPSPNASAAEKAGQIYPNTPESALDQIVVVERPPHGEEEISSFRSKLTAYLQAQATEVGLHDFDLPEEFFASMRLARVIEGAGMPSFTNWWCLLTTRFITYTTSRDAPDRRHLDFWSGHADLDALLYWQIGDQGNDAREVWYCYSRKRSDPEQASQWRIIERMDVESYAYESLSEYLNQTTIKLEKELATGKGLEETWRQFWWAHCLY